MTEFKDEDSAPVEDLEPMDYDKALSYSQIHRRRIVDSLMAGPQVTSDTKELSVVLKALSDMDKSVLMERKNNIDQGSADSSKAVAEAMREFITGQNNTNPFARKADGSVTEPVPTTVIPEVDMEKLGEHQLVDGEDEIGVISETYNEFMNRMEGDKED